MKRTTAFIACLLVFCVSLSAQNVSLNVVNRPASQVFRTLMQQTGKNFVYSSELLRDLKVSISVTDKPLKKVLDEIFYDTEITYKIRGKNVILKKGKKKEKS